ncbi:hypothetical protein RI129_002949 [Pyrocoelia pectoralis]|uniref:Putative nuclease HARBI1 n=1 Tax=Pyrocoelia pectoralis TaxID=417401 RepID=A0AAN7VHD2_9COLE
MENFIDEMLELDEIDIVENINPERRPYVVCERPDHFNEMDELDFFRRFRLKKATVERLLEQIEAHLMHPTNRNHCVTPINQLLIALRFYATGSLYLVTGDFGGVSKTTAANIIKKVTHAIANLRPEYIKLPITELERNRAMNNFYTIARFPRVLGALDCTHVRIQSPGGNIAENFRNRKGFFSINVQAVCDANLRFIDIVGRWPGASHDSNIFDNSRIKAMFENGELPNGFLVSDSSYAVRTYLITPLLEPRTPAENLFNESQIRTRNVIERTFGVWKRRFPILSVGMRCRIPLTQAIIVATAILHNIARNENENLPPDDDVPIEANNEGIIENPAQPIAARDTSVCTT